MTVEQIAADVPPVIPEGRALAFIIVTGVCMVLSYMVMGMRIWCRGIWLSKVWGLDDTLAVLGLVSPSCAPAFFYVYCCIVGDQMPPNLYSD